MIMEKEDVMDENGETANSKCAYFLLKSQIMLNLIIDCASNLLDFRT